MIRFVVGLFLFAVALCAYIVSLPQNDGRRPVQPIAVAPTVELVPEIAVTRAAGSDISAADALAAIGAASGTVDATMPDLGFLTHDTPLSGTIRNELIGLRLEQPSADATGPTTAFEGLLVQTMRDRIGDARIAQKITDAALSGAITVPDVLVTADGGIGAPTLLAAIIARAGLGSGGAVAPAQEAAVGQTHIVAAGESLGGFAMRYYGDVGHADMLLRANPETISRPELIAVGQSLVIPAL